MNEVELNEILQSDWRLWEAAEETAATPDAITKAIDLPYGIGRTEITLEGIGDAIGKRNALQSFGEYIRGLVKDRTDDEAVTARAQQAAARAESSDSENGIYVGVQRVQDEESVPEVAEESDQTHEGPAVGAADFRETLIDKRALLAANLGEAEANCARWRKELRAVDAALVALGDDDGTPSDT